MILKCLCEGVQSLLINMFLISSQQLQVACTIKMKSITSFFKQPAKQPEKIVVSTEPALSSKCTPKEPALSKCDTGTGEHTKGEKCQNKNQNLVNGKLGWHGVNGFVVDCNGDSERPPSDREKAVKPDKPKPVVEKKPNADILNSSLDDFQTPKKPRPTKKRSLKQKNVKTEVPAEPASTEENEPVLEISYEDFLRKNACSENIEETASADNTEQMECEEMSENVNNSPGRKDAPDSDVPTLSPVEQHSETTPARKSRSRHCKGANETPKSPTAECDSAEEEKPKPPAVNIMNYFSASRKSDAKRKSTDQLVVCIAAEVHSPPTESPAHKVFDIFSTKRRNSPDEDARRESKHEDDSCASPGAAARRRSSNVVVESADVDLTITQLEPPHAQGNSGRSSAKVTNGSSKQDKVKVASTKANNAGKKVTESSGKKVTEASGKKVTEGSGKKVTEVSQKKGAETSEKKGAETSQKKGTETPGKKFTETPGKKVTETSQKKGAETSQKKGTETSQKKDAETPGKKVTENSGKKVTESSGKKVTESSGKKTKNASENKVTEALKKKPEMKESTCTSKSNVDCGKQTSLKEIAVIDITRDEHSTTNAANSDIISGITKNAAVIENDALEKRKCSAAVKIASLNTIDIPTGRSQTQMTLNYSRRKTEGSVLQKPLVRQKNKKVTRRRRRRDLEPPDDTSDDDDMNTRDVARNRRKRLRQGKVSKTQDRHEHVVESLTPTKGAVSEDVYESVFVEAGCRQKKTPIKLKITRYVIFNLMF